MAPWSGELAPPPPSWVERFPSDPDMYIGIGRADKLDHPGDYREQAQAAALSQISREISIEVKAENFSSQTENGNGWQETYTQHLTTSSRNELSGYELADTYETGTGFWALYTLDKETFRQALDEKESAFASRLDREAASLESALSAHRIQDAVDRYAALRKEYADFFAANALLRNRSAIIASRFATVTEKINSAVRNLALVSAPSTWTFAVTMGSVSKTTGTAQVFLVDGVSGNKWPGPLSLTLVNRMHPENPCRLETDGEDRLNPDRAFPDCGWEPGPRTLTWMGPDHAVRQDVEVEWRPLDIALEIRAQGLPGSGKAQAQLREGLSALHSPYYRIAAGRPGALPALDIRILEVTLDSLEGMYFTSLKADVTLPGVGGTTRLCGKAGHADRERSRSRAAQDFVKAVERLLQRNSCNQNTMVTNQEMPLNP